jgi:hypothetical protein
MPDPFEGVEFTPEQKNELLLLRRGFALLNSVSGDVDVRRKLRAANPTAGISVPEDDIAEPLLKPLRERLDAIQTDHTETLAKIDEKTAAFDSKVAEWEQKHRDAADLGDLQKKIAAAAKHYRFTDEGTTALIEHMKTTGTADPMTAGAYLVQNMERPAPVAETGLAPEQARRNGAPDVDLFNISTGQDDESMKLLHSGPKGAEKWMQTEINKIIAEGQEAA